MCWEGPQDSRHEECTSAKEGEKHLDRPLDWNSPMAKFIEDAQVKVDSTPILNKIGKFVLAIIASAIRCTGSNYLHTFFKGRNYEHILLTYLILIPIVIYVVICSIIFPQSVRGHRP
ncbi:hypothetical protein K470DRAFT_255962 [Piedraia hortae CBS 480.64]|uniref:Uncharacterized protein n=1 Tax=Piedraia hortae CBS 480.64 TaxID=1314780 RepID=A0A6A7C4D0_9PEZI|nr:hypothetical protein K470DRAFT_255962 [Piedraia hortae CBS 480.64]